MTILRWVIPMEDRIDRLGTYFVYFNVRERFNITFEQFVYLVDIGAWAEIIA
jgi:hypothetical protein